MLNVTSDGSWLERGEGTPVVFLHGVLGSAEQWETTLEVVGTVARAIAPPLPLLTRGHEEPTIPALADDVVRFLDRLSLERAVLGGHSLGGHIAAEAALRHPDRVGGLVLTAASGLFERGVTRGVPHQLTAACVRATMTEVVFDPALVTDEWVEATLDLLVAPGSPTRLMRLLYAARHHRLEPQLSAIRVPTLLVWGEEDRITPLGVGQQCLERIPRSTLVVLRRCGHAPMIEHPWAFGRMVSAWLEETWRAASAAAVPAHVDA